MDGSDGNRARGDSPGLPFPPETASFPAKFTNWRFRNASCPTALPLFRIHTDHSLSPKLLVEEQIEEEESSNARSRSKSVDDKMGWLDRIVKFVAPEAATLLDDFKYRWQLLKEAKNAGMLHVVLIRGRGGRVCVAAGGTMLWWMPLFSFPRVPGCISVCLFVV